MDMRVILGSDIEFDGIYLGHLGPASEAEVRKIIVMSFSKSCKLNPVPTSLLKSRIDCSITAIVYKSAAPTSFRNAVVRPL